MPFLPESTQNEIRIVLGYPPKNQLPLSQLEMDYPTEYIDYINSLLEQIDAQLEQSTSFRLTQLGGLNVKRLEDMEFFSPAEYQAFISTGASNLIDQLSQILGLPRNLPIKQPRRSSTAFQYQ